MSERLFRPAHEDEVEHIAHIAVKAWQPIFAYYRQALGVPIFERLYARWEEQKAEQVREAFRNRPACVYVTVQDGQIVGFATFVLNDATGVGDIGNNAVDPDHQGQGIGTFQHTQVLRIMRERGMRLARVTTGSDPAHAPARRSYEKAGFALSTESITYYRAL